MNNYSIKVVEAKYIGSYKMRLKFSTGEERIVDMKPQLRGEVFEPLKKTKDYLNNSKWTNT